jgi:predicted ferric reductase
MSPSSPSKWAQWEAFFFNEGANLAFLALLMSFNVCMFVWGVWEFTKPHWTTESSVLRVTLPTARGAGRLVTWNSAVLLVTGCKHLCTLVRQSPVHLGLPVDNSMPHYHRVVALIIIFMGCVVHSIPHIVNYATQELAIKGGPVWTFGDGLATKQLLITGILLFFLFLAFFVTTLECLRRKAWGFRLFSSVHICGIACAIPLLLIHGTIRASPITLYFTILPVCLYLVDSLVLRRYLFSTRQAEVIHLTCTPLCGDTSNGDDNDGEHVVKLVIRNPDFRFTPGQYAEINIPQLARYEWHPFTIANAPNLEGKVVFYIKAAGRWTSALHELVSEASVKGGDLPIASVGVRGPYGAPAQD